MPALALAPAAFYAFSPLLEPFVFAKYDALPTALATVGILLFAARRPGLSGLALGLGTVIKWTPSLAAPFLLLHQFRQRYWHGLLRLAGWGVAAGVLCSLPFALADMGIFTLPYRLQGGRDMNGESVWALVALLLEPALYSELDAPWGPLKSSMLSLWLMTVVQLAVLGASGVLALLKPCDMRRTLALAAMAPALFLASNRVFSPQYMLPISVAVLAALAVLPPRRTTMVVALVLLVLAQVANLLVWPFFVGEYWLLASGVLFAALAVLLVGAHWYAARAPGARC
jgi:hypothetical protein